jgi:transcriptional regulator with XRE-family HTH domain
MNAFALQLRAARLASGLTTEDIAYKAGVGHSTVNRAMMGRNIRLDALLAIAEVLGVRALTLTCEHDAPPTGPRH